MTFWAKVPVILRRLGVTLALAIVLVWVVHRLTRWLRESCSFRHGSDCFSPGSI